jgi:polyhydroxyalkanoate synthesis regulator protein
MTRQNVAIFERAMKMFTPFAGTMGQWTDKDTPNPFTAAFGGSSQRPNGAPEQPASPRRDEEIRELKDQLAAMRQQIADLAQRK